MGPIIGTAHQSAPLHLHVYIHTRPVVTNDAQAQQTHSLVAVPGCAATLNLTLSPAAAHKKSPLYTHTRLAVPNGARHSWALRSTLTLSPAAAHQKSPLYTHTRPAVPNGARHSGHSGFWLCQAAMQAQQNTWPQGTAVGTSRAPRHSAQRRFCGTSAHSAPAPSAGAGAAAASLPSSYQAASI